MLLTIMDYSGIINYGVSENLWKEVKMQILSKRLGNGEVKWRGLVIPRRLKHNFPSPEVEFDLWEGKTLYRVKVDKQFRIRLASWFRQHPTIKAGDQVTFLKENGKMRIALVKNFSEPQRGTLDWGQEVIQAIKDGEIHGIIRITQNGFTVEIGEHIKETQIVVAT